jgi:hypothetical protein
VASPAALKLALQRAPAPGLPRVRVQARVLVQTVRQRLLIV